LQMVTGHKVLGQVVKKRTNKKSIKARAKKYFSSKR